VATGSGDTPGGGKSSLLDGDAEADAEAETEAGVDTAAVALALVSRRVDLVAVAGDPCRIMICICHF